MYPLAVISSDMRLMLGVSRRFRDTQWSWMCGMSVALSELVFICIFPGNDAGITKQSFKKQDSKWFVNLFMIFPSDHPRAMAFSNCMRDWEASGSTAVGKCPNWTSTIGDIGDRNSSSYLKVMSIYAKPDMYQTLNYNFGTWATVGFWEIHTSPATLIAFSHLGVQGDWLYCRLGEDLQAWFLHDNY